MRWKSQCLLACDTGARYGVDTIQSSGRTGLNKTTKKSGAKRVKRAWWAIFSKFSFCRLVKPASARTWPYPSSQVSSLLRATKRGTRRLSAQLKRWSGAAEVQVRKPGEK